MAIPFRLGRTFLMCLLLAGSTYHVQAQEFFTRFMIDEDFVGANSVIMADIDGDLDQDVLGASLVDSDVTWWANSDSARSWTGHPVAIDFLGARYAGAADLDGDDDLDLFGAAAAVDQVGWWRNEDGIAGAWTFHAISDTFDFAIDLFAGDIDGDEDIDLAGAALKGDAIVWWENLDAAGGSWVEHTVDLEMNGARNVFGIDVDGDEDMDLVGTAKNDDIVRVWENTLGDGTEWEATTISESTDGVVSIFPADIDGDEDIDLLVTAEIDDDVIWWEQTETGWVERIVDSNFDGAISAIAVDMDNDEDLDIVAAGTANNSINWWENLFGSGAIWVQHVIDDDYLNPTFVNAGDLDGDGDVDVFAGNLGGEVAWWRSDQVDPQLPVELVRFDALADGRFVQLSWETAVEVNNAGFLIQHYDVLSGWQDLVFIDGAGSTDAPQFYQHVVGPFDSGRHRFRLRQTDFDGTFSYSPVAAAIVTDGEPYELSAVYPNPFNPQAQFTLRVAVPQPVQIDIYNSLGQRVSQFFNGILGPEEVHRFSLDGANLPGGAYLIHVQGTHFVSSTTAILLK